MPGGDRGIEGGERSRIVAVVPGIDDVDLGDAPIARRDERPEPAEMLVPARDQPSTLATGGRGQRPGVHRVCRRVGQGDGADVAAEDRRDAGPSLRHPAQEVLERVRVCPPDVAFPGGDLGHRGGRLRGQRPDGAGVEVDPGGEGRKRGSHRLELLGAGREGGDHGRMIPAMNGLARPEILATTEWLAEQLGRPGSARPRPPLAP